MVSHLREAFNKNFSEARYQLLLHSLDATCGMHVDFRVCETPLFIPSPLMKWMEVAGKEIIMQLVSNAAYLSASRKAIPPDFCVANETPYPLFIAIDFGLTQTTDGEYAPKLIEMQGFPTLFAYQVAVSQLYKEVYGLPRELTPFLGGLDLDRYYAMLRNAILGGHAPENVVLMEIDPENQKTRPDFLLTERICGIATVDIRGVVKEGRKLFYRTDGRLIPIERIYNRTIVDELVKSNAKLPFSFRDDLDVEWAGHPNWFFRLSKFSLPFLDHPTVPKTFFLSDLQTVPDDLGSWVLKPLFSFAGSGVIVSPTRADIDAVAESDRQNYVLQEKVEYGAFVHTPNGGTKAEVRVVYFWVDRQPFGVITLVRMGRGKMMGVNYNKDFAWVGSSAGLYLE